MKLRASLLLLLILLSGCISTKGYLKGVAPGGEKVYLGPAAIENTGAYRQFLQSGRAETDKQHYLFSRLKASEGLEFLHDGRWYNKLEAYRGGMWLMRNRYKKGRNTRAFIKNYIEYSEAGNLHLVRYPGGTLQIGSYVLYNELDLLEEKLKKQNTP